KLLIIQLGEGDKLRAKAFTEQIRNEEIEAERGTIYSEMGEVLSTSVPEFDIYVDYKADGLIDQDGLLFKQHIDSLTLGLANLFKDKTAKQYKQEMLAAYNRRERFSLLRRKISFTEYEALKQLPLVKLGRNKSGFIAMVRPRRLYPFQMLANRTIGLMRDSNKVGIEKSYDKYLQGTTGRRLVRYIAGGAGVPLEGTEQDPVDGSDVFTTLDVNIQDIAHQALHRMMVSNEALRGTCIVMEVKTGKIKAIANLGRQKDGSYWEDYNYALAASEPGSTWKLVTLLAALQDNKINLQSTVNLEGGRWQVAGQTVFDSEPHGTHEATVQQAFERSSNVGMAKLAYYHYGQQPSRFISHIKQFRMDTLTGVDLPGEARPQIYKPGSKYWSNTTLPWMGFGYNLTVTPLHTAMLYNAIANGGKMMKPYVVSAIRKDGEVVHSFSPQVLVDSI
ncbi:MAG TPA: penicillin-binding transpeptidase domain-containing protein, partial [Phnomibacter sp.]|nr:penicillin-binding transpeptidase domain-containing protein [Phnomibacter sp.]